MNTEAACLFPDGLLGLPPLKVAPFASRYEAECSLAVFTPGDLREREKSVSYEPSEPGTGRKI